MPAAVWQGIWIPFLGTTLGAAGVFFLRRELPLWVQRALTGFAAGVMVAASIWSLLLPAMEQAAELGPWSFWPAVAGFWLGILFLLVLDRVIPHLHRGSREAEGIKSGFGKTTMLTLAVALHNIPEGMSLGLAFSIAALSQDPAALSGAFALALGMSIQNIPEGAAVSLPLACGTTSRAKAFAVGVFSGAMEPLFGVLTVLALSLVVPYLPWLLAFAAGAMMYVVVEELIPAAHLNEHSDLGTLSVMAGFVVMMLLDTTLG